MDINFISYVPAIVGILAIGLFVLLNGQDAKNKSFALFSLLTALWLGCLLWADISQNVHLSLWILRFGLFFASCAILAIDYFTLLFPYPTRISNFKKIFYSLPLIIVALLSFSPLVLPTISLQGFVAEPQNTSFLYTLSDIVSIVYLVAGILLLVGKLKKSDPHQKQQIKFVLIGMAIAVVVNILTGDVLTLFKVDTSYIDFGGFSLLIFSIFVAYAMIKHGFLDIRLIVARAVAYTLTLGSIAVTYSAIIIGILSHFDKVTRISTFQSLLYISIAVFLSITFQPIKRFFDKVTNRLFFRDAYDTQAFLDQFNKILVTTYELDPILKKSASIIEDNLKPSYCIFGIKETSNTPRRIIGTTGHPKFSESDINFVRDITPKMRRKLIISDLLEVKYEKLQQVLRDNNISVIARLASSLNEEGIGYIVLGPKKSGNLYNPQDLKVIEIVANELVIAIQNALHTEEIENFNLTLQAKVDDATKKLQQTNEKLKQLDETKDDFISMASHQLRTPLTSVKGYLSMVLEGDAGKVNATQTKMLHQAFISSQRMVFLITDLLNVSRLKTGKFVIENTPVDLNKLIQEEVTQLVETAQVKHIEITYNKPTSFPMLMLDETKIRQVGMNFMDNAIYYTPVGGHINVELIDNPTTVELRVTDNGIGVPKSEQHHLFTKFYRATNARKTRPDGTGLGLFMAKKVIAAQGGSILFESKDGQGSTFGFVFSKAKLKVPESAAINAAGTSLESPEPQHEKPKTNSLTPVR